MKQHEWIGIDHVQLAAPKGCEEIARSFYGMLLGLIELEKPEHLKKRGGCWFQCGNQEIHIGVEVEFSPAKKAHPAFRVKNLSGLEERLKEGGIELKEDIPINGRRRFFASDPFGNRVEFLEYEG
ncbi:VOC family protein [Bacillus sp. 03113]|uniref:VOC family protein n=1 Tax=Bacillus sp. 03113 TaxID=2578211 RepID=UPI0011429C91|nr:VOC family protein [Bacillus sp. 03113]